jgi:CRISPR-associated protein Cas5t
MKTPLCLFVEVPVCAFRPYASREYQDTHPVPPPSAVYGMLLSLVGVSRREKARHRGVAMALAVESLPPRSRVFRKLRRGEKDLIPKFRPDYQDILIDLRLWVWLKPGRDDASPDLPSRVAQALANPPSVTRWGGLSLGESTYLVDSVSIGKVPPAKLTFLRPDPRGFHHLTTWVDHADFSKSRSECFTLTPLDVSDALETCWFNLGVK